MGQWRFGVYAVVLAVASAVLTVPAAAHEGGCGPLGCPPKPEWWSVDFTVYQDGLQTRPELPEDLIRTDTSASGQLLFSRKPKPDSEFHEAKQVTLDRLVQHDVFMTQDFISHQIDSAFSFVRSAKLKFNKHGKAVISMVVHLDAHTGDGADPDCSPADVLFRMHDASSDSILINHHKTCFLRREFAEGPADNQQVDVGIGVVVAHYDDPPWASG